MFYKALPQRPVTRSEGAKTTRGRGNFEDSGAGADRSAPPCLPPPLRGGGGKQGGGEHRRWGILEVTRCFLEARFLSFFFWY